MEFLLFTVHAPMSAFGDVVMGRHRSSWDRPSKSGMLGLAAAALGIDRADNTGHRQLHEGLGFAVRSDALGESMTDFHTVQVGQGVNAKRALTRRDELAVAKIATLPTYREYRSDAVHTIALWRRAEVGWALQEIANALREPRWALYVGRRCCPLSLPLNPEILEAPDLMNALAMRPALPEPIADALGLELGESLIATEADTPGVKPTQITTRRDVYGRTENDLRWFHERSEWRI